MSSADYKEIGRFFFSNTMNTVVGNSTRCDGSGSTQSCFSKCYGRGNAMLMVDETQATGVVEKKDDSTQLFLARRLFNVQLGGDLNYTHVPLGAVKIQSTFAEVDGCKCCDLLPDLSEPVVVPDIKFRGLQLSMNPSQVIFRSFAQNCTASSTQVISNGNPPTDGNLDGVNVDVLMNEFTDIPVLARRQLSNGTPDFRIKQTASTSISLYTDQAEDARCSTQVNYDPSEATYLGVSADIGTASLGPAEDPADENCGASSCFNRCYSDLIISAQTEFDSEVRLERGLQTLNFETLNDLVANLYLRPTRQIPGCRCCDLRIEDVEDGFMYFSASSSQCYIGTTEVAPENPAAPSDGSLLNNAYVQLRVAGNTSITIFDNNLQNTTFSTGPVQVSITNNLGFRQLKVSDGPTPFTCNYPTPSFTLGSSGPGVDSPSAATNMSLPYFTTLLMLFLFCFMRRH